MMRKISSDNSIIIKRNDEIIKLSNFSLYAFNFFQLEIG